jgi:FkbM family methyltransferase
MSTTIGKVRPAKIRSALRRRWFEYQLNRLPLQSGPTVVSLGSEYGGWDIPEGIVDDSWMCWSVGAGDDVSFDVELVRRYGAQVRAFEPVPEYVQHARQTFGDDPRLSAYQVAIATADGPVRLQLTHDSESRSVSSAGLYDSDEWAEAPGRTVASMMHELGDQRIDLLKLDIEGGEYEVVPTLDLRAWGVKIFATQLHHTGTVGQARQLLDSLADLGFRLVGRHPTVKLTFLRDG